MEKADAAMNDGAIINLNINDNWTKTQSKFITQIIRDPIIDQIPKWDLNPKMSMM